MNDAMNTLKRRFHQYPDRHDTLTWEELEAMIQAKEGALAVLEAMEASGGEPDVIRYEGDWILVDLCQESPKGRRGLCYDEAARITRKKFPPASSVEAMADAMGVRLVDEELYRHIQTFGPLDTKTSSWIATPASVRELGGALFGDHRYGLTFVYHNGADSYYGSRGFRGYRILA